MYVSEGQFGRRGKDWRGVVNLKECGSCYLKKGRLFGQEILFVVARLFNLVRILLRLLKNEGLA